MAHQAHEMDDSHLEAEHFAQVFRSFQTYSENSLSIVHRRKLDLGKINPEHAKLLKEKTNHHDRFKRSGASVLRNQKFLNEILNSASAFMNPLMESMLSEENRQDIFVSEMNKDKVRSTIKQCVRDWSFEGELERKECYDPILQTLMSYYPDNRSNIRVLVPGAGLGRLAWEIARIGFETQGNEFSYFMLLTSNFILNNIPKGNSYTIDPYVHQTNNLFSSSDQFRSIQIPDIHPSELPETSNFSMTAGEFMEVYHDEHGQWNVIVTCFFLDTAKNVLDYLATFSSLLKPGGIWINLGPLLYHYSDNFSEISIELSYDEILALLPSFGFSLQSRESSPIRCHYASNPRSMLEMSYNCAYFTCIKL